MTLLLYQSACQFNIYGRKHRIKRILKRLSFTQVLVIFHSVRHQGISVIADKQHTYMNHIQAQRSTKKLNIA